MLDPFSFVSSAVANDSNVDGGLRAYLAARDPNIDRYWPVKPGDVAGAVDDLAGNRPVSAAMQRAYDQLARVAAQSVHKTTKRTAREYVERPERMALLCPILPLCSPDDGLARVAELKADREHPVWRGQRSAVVNLRGAAIGFRYLRRFRKPEPLPLDDLWVEWETVEVTEAGVDALASDPCGETPIGTCPFTGDPLVDVRADDPWFELCAGIARTVQGIVR